MNYPEPNATLLMKPILTLALLVTALVATFSTTTKFPSLLLVEAFTPSTLQLRTPRQWSARTTANPGSTSTFTPTLIAVPSTPSFSTTTSQRRMSLAYTEFKKAGKIKRTVQEKVAAMAHLAANQSDHFDLKTSVILLKKRFNEIHSELEAISRERMMARRKRKRLKNLKDQKKFKEWLSLSLEERARRKALEESEDFVPSDEGEDFDDEEDDKEYNRKMEERERDTMLFAIAAKSASPTRGLQHWVPVVRLMMEQPRERQSNATNDYEKIAQAAVSLYRREIYQMTCTVYPCFKHQPRMEVQYGISYFDPYGDSNRERFPRKFDKFPMTIPYARDILGVGDGYVTEELARSALEKITKECNPDLFVGDEEGLENAKKNLQLANRAYEAFTAPQDKDKRHFDGPIEFMRDFGEAWDYLQEHQVEATIAPVDPRTFDSISGRIYS